MKIKQRNASFRWQLATIGKSKEILSVAVPCCNRRATRGEQFVDGPKHFISPRQHVEKTVGRFNGQLLSFMTTALEMLHKETAV